MAFKSMDDYNQNRYNGMFILQNDGDYADVIFMYRSKRDVLVADTHYIRSSDYNGYVHCCGRGCPACAKGIRVQSKLFIPMYIISENRVLFFDRSVRFDAQLQNDVFSRYPNPSEYVFRITRHGASGDVNTRYEIMAVGRNTVMSYDDILASLNIRMPDYFDTVCKEFSSTELNHMINVSAPAASYGSAEIPDYQVSARRSAVNVAQPTVESAVDLIPSAPELDSLIPDVSDEDISDEVDF